jgi:hypothetical protein
VIWKEKLQLRTAFRVMKSLVLLFAMPASPFLSNGNTNEGKENEKKNCDYK